MRKKLPIYPRKAPAMVVKVIRQIKTEANLSEADVRQAITEWLLNHHNIEVDPSWIKWDITTYDDDGRFDGALIDHTEEQEVSVGQED